MSYIDTLNAPTQTTPAVFAEGFASTQKFLTLQSGELSAEQAMQSIRSKIGSLPLVPAGLINRLDASMSRNGCVATSVCAYVNKFASAYVPHIVTYAKGQAAHDKAMLDEKTVRALGYILPHHVDAANASLMLQSLDNPSEVVTTHFIKWLAGESK